MFIRSFLVVGLAAAALAQNPVSGELRQWHKVTLTLPGPQASEKDSDPNPFTDYRMTVTFTHESGTPRYEVPGYFAADGKAGETSATAGNQWRAHLSPDKAGRWDWQVSFVQGRHVALDGGAGKAVTPIDGRKGSFRIAATNKRGRDFRAHGRLQYVGKHHLRFAGSGEYFLKAGTDSPETLLGYEEFDGTSTNKIALKKYKPHTADWRPGDPSWKGGEGKGLVGALNYLASKGLNSFSFLPYNAGGDGDNVWPFVARDDKMHYDCSKLDQWAVVFEHGQAQGLYLHFKLQEQENDDNFFGHNDGGNRKVAAALDGGDLGPERKLYLRELIARFGHNLALNWNLGEENTQTPEQQRAMSKYIHDTDPYDHHIVVHTFPDWQDKVYPPLLGSKSVLTGASLQNAWDAAHERTVKWIRESAAAGKPWVVANDEQGTAMQGIAPDPGYQGYNGVDKQGKRPPSIDDVRRYTLWGNLMAGGAGVEYYFGYQLAENDLLAEDFRSRDRNWTYCDIALRFFRENRIPFWDMVNVDEKVGNPAHDNSRYALAKAGEVYLVYLPKGGAAKLDLAGAAGSYAVSWFNPRAGGKLQTGAIATVNGGGAADLGSAPDSEDWLVVLRKK